MRAERGATENFHRPGLVAVSAAAELRALRLAKAVFEGSYLHLQATDAGLRAFFSSPTEHAGTRWLVSVGVVTRLPTEVVREQGEDVPI